MIIKIMSERMVYCGSDVLERDILDALGIDEYPDGEFVPISSCQDCKGCPNNPDDYTPPSREQIEAIKSDKSNRYSRGWF